ncbi:MAG: DNA-3-methyladenine glycosylase 2 family protein [Ruminococcaceae bacterium]|nr:DNA-3-methyladenine glycosylase 2 family protein [Oscillospiraceae bacterium]
MKQKFVTRKIKLNSRDIFSPAKTFDCGQCFRFEEKGGYTEGVVSGALLRIKTGDSQGEIEYMTTKEEGIDSFFDPDRCYYDMSDDFISRFDGRGKDALNLALEKGFGIRILKQEFWEALISFIISQNNNIPRIKKNISSISRAFGERFVFESEDYYAFPTPDALLDAGVGALEELKLGFRAKYIVDAARRVILGEINEEELLLLDTDSASKKLQTIYGVGPKVAACTLLYGLGRLETVPVDVWMKKVFSKYFDTTPDLGIWGGVAQQYLFYNERFIIEGK